MGKVLLRIFFVIVVVQIPDGLPVLLILTEVHGHRAHAGGDICGVELQMILRDHGAVQAFCFFNSQFIHAFIPPQQML